MVKPLVLVAQFASQAIVSQKPVYKRKLEFCLGLDMSENVGAVFTGFN